MPAPVSFPAPDPFKPQTPTGIDQHLRQLAITSIGTMDGKINAAQDFDLALSPAVTTTITDARVRGTSRILLHPVNDHAAGDLASGTVEILDANVLDGSFTVSHLPSTLTRSFRTSFLS